MDWGYASSRVIDGRRYWAIKDRQGRVIDVVHDVDPYELAAHQGLLLGEDDGTDCTT